MRRLRLRELERVNYEASMLAAGQNLKRLLKKRGWGRRPYPAEAVFCFLLAWFGLFRPSWGYASPSTIIRSPSHLSKHTFILSS